MFREFNGAIKIAPDKAQIDWLGNRYPDAALHTFIKHGNSRWRETKWLGSYRYAIVNLGGASREDLERRYEEVCQQRVVRSAARRSGSQRTSMRCDQDRVRSYGSVTPIASCSAAPPSSATSPQKRPQQ